MLTRRNILKLAGSGFGYLAFAALAHRDTPAGRAKERSATCGENGWTATGDLVELRNISIQRQGDTVAVLDLDEEAAALCRQRGIRMARAASAGVHAKFVQMIRSLVEERIGRTDQRPALGDLGPWHDVCPQDCCLYTPRRPAGVGSVRRARTSMAASW